MQVIINWVLLSDIYLNDHTLWSTTLREGGFIAEDKAS